MGAFARCSFSPELLLTSSSRLRQKKDMEVLRGYLSLHQAGDNLTLKWTPNQLINGTLGDCDLEKRCVYKIQINGVKIVSFKCVI